MKTKQFVALCVLYGIGSGCGITTMALHSGAVDALITVIFAVAIPAWLLLIACAEEAA